MSKEIPEPPEFLSSVAAVRWTRLWAHELDRAFIKPSTHADIVAAYAAAWSEFTDANSKIAETNTVLTRGEKIFQNPYVEIRDRAWATMETAAKVLGINQPASKPKLRSLASLAETLLAPDEDHLDREPPAPRLLT
jgi:P27 family predicted phage terminase small subunit